MLVGLNRENPIQDFKVVKHLNNRQYMICIYCSVLCNMYAQEAAFKSSARSFVLFEIYFFKKEKKFVPVPILLVNLNGSCTLKINSGSTFNF